MNLPTIADNEVLAQQAFKEILKNMCAVAGGIVFYVVDLLHKNNLDASPKVDRVFLYRRPLLDY